MKLFRTDEVIASVVTAPAVVVFQFSVIISSKTESFYCKELKRLYRLSFKAGLLPFRL